MTLERRGEIPSRDPIIGADGDLKKLIGNYYISGGYGFKNVHLGYEDDEWGGIGLINQPINAVGHNDHYIVAKREATETEYFVLKIVDSGVHSEAKKNIKGLLTEVEYKETLRELGLLEVKWTKKFEKLNGINLKDD
jgi:hypothetical protein